MARLAVTFTVIFILFAISSARTPLDLPESEIVARDLPNSLPAGSDTDPTILLPTEKSEIADVKPLETNTLQFTDHLPESETLVSFRPIHRHFGGKRGCRHQIKPMNPRFHGREVPYGHDMILSSGQSSDFDPMMFRGGDRRIPGRWGRLHHHFHHHHHHHDDTPMFPLKHHMFGKEEFKRPFHHHEEEEEREEGGFMMRFRKFLNHF